MKSIQTKLMTIVSILVILLLVGEGLVSFLFMKSSLESKSKDSLKLQTEEFATLLSESEKSIQLLRTQAFDAYDKNIRNQVENANSLTQSFYEQVQNGAITESEGKAKALHSLRNIVYGENGYFWIDDTSYNIVLLPPTPEKEGTNRENAVDENGTQYAKMFVDGAKESKDNFVDYYFPKPGEDTTAYQKRGYTMLFEPWQWVIGTGNYVDDIENYISQYESEMKNSINESITKLSKHGAAGVLSQDGIMQYFGDTEAVGKKIEIIDTEKGGDIIAKILQTKNGFLEYTIDNPLSGKNQKEIAYVHYDEKNNRHIFVSQTTDHVFTGVNESIVNTVILVIVGIILATVVTFIVARSFARPIMEIQKVSEEVSNGNLSVDTLKIRSNDEIGRLASSINEMLLQIKGLIMQASSIAEKVSSSSEELAASSNEMKDGIEQVAATSEEIAGGASSQASDATETLDRVRTVTDQTEMMATHAKEMKQYSEEANTASIHGLNSVNQSMQQIQMIEGKVTETAQVIQSLSDKSKDINHILSVISDISNQTNLLALNAAIEAARAGEHGKGFAVVADEVRKLAEETSNSTRQIADIVQAVESESEQAARSMGAMVNEVQHGLKVIEGNKDAFQSISTIINDITNRIDEIHSSAVDNTKNVQEVLKLVENIAAVTEESSAGTEELSASMEQQNASVQQISAMAIALSGLVDELNRTIAQFKI